MKMIRTVIKLAASLFVGGVVLLAVGWWASGKDINGWA